MSFIGRLLLLFLFIIPLMSQDLNDDWQDLNDAWHSYILTNTSISTLNSERAYYTHEQVVIKNTVDNLQQGSVWYNAWFNKYLLSNYSKRQLVLLDSLKAIDDELIELKNRQRIEVEDLRHAYESLLVDYETAGVLPAEQGVRNLQIGRWQNVMDRFGPILFPDYKELLNLQFRNPDQRKIILIDIQQLIKAKIFELDSVRNVREDEEELAHRLASFHQDLGLQMEADQDAQQRNASGNSEKVQGWFAADAASGFSEGRGELDMSNETLIEPIDLVSVNVPREEAREMSLDQHSGNDLNYLKMKITEYEALLEEINEELDQSP